MRVGEEHGETRCVFSRQGVGFRIQETRWRVPRAGDKVDGFGCRRDKVEGFSYRRQGGELRVQGLGPPEGVCEEHGEKMCPTPSTLHPTPCTLHPTPYTQTRWGFGCRGWAPLRESVRSTASQDVLHPTSYTLHSTLYTLHPAP